jgi:hypothetical protein
MADEKEVESLRLIYNDLTGRIKGDRDTSWRIIGLCGVLLPLLRLLLTRLPKDIPLAWHVVLTALLFLCSFSFLLSIFCGVVSVVAFRPLFSGRHGRTQGPRRGTTRQRLHERLHLPPGRMACKIRLHRLWRRLRAQLFGGQGMKAWQQMTKLTKVPLTESVFHTSGLLARWESHTCDSMFRSLALSTDFSRHLWEYCVFLAGLIEVRKKPQLWALRLMLLGFGFCLLTLMAAVIASCFKGN